MNSRLVERATADTLDIQRVMEILPHRYPFLMVDRVVDIVPYVSAVGIKNVTIGEPYFQGHFPNHPVMPGVLVIEAMAQSAAVLVVYSLGAEAKGKLVYFVSVDSVRFRKPVVPGDTLNVHVRKERRRGKVWKFRCEAKVDGTIVAEGTVAAMTVDA